jgi:hypothetical protein
LSLLTGAVCLADDLQITALKRDGTLNLANTFTNGVVTVLKAASLDGPWQPEKNVFSTGAATRANLTLADPAAFYRGLALDLTGPDGFNNLANSYGLLSTVAGAGGATASPMNKWLPEFEGGPATDALLSRPHIAMADRAGNLYIADKEAHAIRKVTPDGLIHTVAGTNGPGRGATDPAPATEVALNNPNGLWAREDGVFYILDRDNGYIRKVDLDGTMTLLADNGGPIPVGRGLWVSADESLLYFSAGTQLKRWDATNGLTVFAGGFSELGNLAVAPDGTLAVTDRSRNQVFRLDADGARTVIAGGTSSPPTDGQLATEAYLWQVRAIWFLPSGAYFLGTDNGSQLWYVDTDGYIHLFLHGNSYAHTGDGGWFYDPLTPKVSRIRQITLDYDGNLIITEHDAGYIRKVQFLPYLPPSDPGQAPE